MVGAIEMRRSQSASTLNPDYETNCPIGFYQNLRRLLPCWTLNKTKLIQLLGKTPFLKLPERTFFAPIPIKPYPVPTMQYDYGTGVTTFSGRRLPPRVVTPLFLQARNKSRPVYASGIIAKARFLLQALLAPELQAHLQSRRSHPKGPSSSPGRRTAVSPPCAG